MQKALNDALHTQHCFITDVNCKNDVVTPFVHAAIVKQRKDGHFKFSYSKMPDGVHPSPELAAAWVAKFSKAIDINKHKLASLLVLLMLSF